MFYQQVCACTVRPDDGLRSRKKKKKRKKKAASNIYLTFFSNLESESLFPQIVNSSRVLRFHGSREKGPASTCTQSRYIMRAFSGVRGKTRDGPVVLGSVLPLLTVIRKKLLCSVERDENRHMLDRNTLIFSSLPLPLTPSATVTQPNTVLGYRNVGFENLYLLRETELDPALLLCFAAVINFACGSAGSAAYRASLCRLRAVPGEDGWGCC